MVTVVVMVTTTGREQGPRRQRGDGSAGTGGKGRGCGLVEDGGKCWG